MPGVDGKIEITLTNLQYYDFNLSAVIELFSNDKVGFYPDTTVLGAKSIDNINEYRHLAEHLGEIPTKNASDISLKSSYQKNDLTATDTRIPFAIFNHGHKAHTYKIKVLLSYVNPLDSTTIMIESNDLTVKYEYSYISTPSLSNVRPFKSAYATRDLAISNNADQIEVAAAVFNEMETYYHMNVPYTSEVFEVLIDNIPLKFDTNGFITGTNCLQSTVTSSFLFNNIGFFLEDNYVDLLFYQSPILLETVFGNITYSHGSLSYKGLAPHVNLTNEFIANESYLSTGTPTKVEILSSRKVRLTFVVKHASMYINTNNISQINYINVRVDHSGRPPIVTTVHWFQPLYSRVKGYAFALIDSSSSLHIVDYDVNDSYRHSSPLSLSTFAQQRPQYQLLSETGHPYEINKFVDEWNRTF